MVGKDGRRWFPLETGFTRDGRILASGERAGWLYVAILGHMHEHQRPGTITDKEIASLGVTGWKQRVSALAAAGLLEKTSTSSDTWFIPAWDSWHVARSQHALYMQEWRRRKRESP